MKLYHQSNNPSVVLSGEPGQYDDVELLLSRTSARSKDADVVIRIEIPDDEMDRLMPHGRSKWTTTNAELRRSGAKVDCATEADRDRAAVYELVAQRHKTLETIGRLRHYIAEAEDRPSGLLQFVDLLPVLILRSAPRFGGIEVEALSSESSALPFFFLWTAFVPS